MALPRARLVQKYVRLRTSLLFLSLPHAALNCVNIWVNSRASAEPGSSGPPVGEEHHAVAEAAAAAAAEETSTTGDHGGEPSEETTGDGCEGTKPSCRYFQHPDLSPAPVKLGWANLFTGGSQWVLKSHRGAYKTYEEIRCFNLG